MLSWTNLNIPENAVCNEPKGNFLSLPLMSMNSIKLENCQRIPSGDIADERTLQFDWLEVIMMINYADISNPSVCSCLSQSFIPCYVQHH